MIEYLGLLLQRGILSSDNTPFQFNNEKCEKKKVIKLKSKSKEVMGEFFLEYLEEKERQTILEELKKKQPICESDKFKLYDNNPNNVFYKIYGVFHYLRPTNFNLLKYCVEQAKKEITVEEYMENVNRGIEAEHAKKHFSLLNNDLGIKVFHSIRGKGWRVDI